MYLGDINLLMVIHQSLAVHAFGTLGILRRHTIGKLVHITLAERPRSLSGARISFQFYHQRRPIRSPSWKYVRFATEVRERRR